MRKLSRGLGSRLLGTTVCLSSSGNWKRCAALLDNPAVAPEETPFARESRHVLVASLRLAALLLVVASMVGTSRAFAEDVPLKAALDKPILEPGVPLKEMRAFVQPRIIKFSPPADRAVWEQTAARLRRDMLDQIVFRGTAAEWRAAKCGTLWLDTIEGGPGYRIRKFRYEALPGMWIPGMLYLPERLEGRVPVAINVNGHAPEGKAVNYKQLRSINLAKRGMLVLNVEWFGMGQLRTRGFAHGRLNQLDLCGASGLAPFYLALQRAVDKIGRAHV